VPPTASKPDEPRLNDRGVEESEVLDAVARRLDFLEI
jgi:hypothetical protein